MHKWCIWVSAPLYLRPDDSKSDFRKFNCSRFPNLNIVVGHLGERIPSDLLRIDARTFTNNVFFSLMSRLSHCKPFFFRIFSHITELFRQIPQDLPPMKKSVTSYFHTNIYETTSGNFATELLKFHINQIGLDRIMYSIDYPWVSLRSVLVFPSLSWLGTSSSSCRWYPSAPLFFMSWRSWYQMELLGSIVCRRC